MVCPILLTTYHYQFKILRDRVVSSTTDFRTFSKQFLGVRRTLRPRLRGRQCDARVSAAASAMVFASRRASVPTRRWECNLQLLRRSFAKNPEAAAITLEELHAALMKREADADLRPEGRSGPLVRSLESYATYYARWSAGWAGPRCRSARGRRCSTRRGPAC